MPGIQLLSLLLKDILMNINVKTGTAEKEPAEMLAFYVYEDAAIIGGALASCNSELNNVIAELIKKKEFIGKLNKSVVLFTYGKIPANRIMLVGIGKKKDVTSDKVRQAAGTTASVARDAGVGEVVAVLDSIEMPSSALGEWTQAFGEGCLLAGYNFLRYKKVSQEEQKEVKAVTLLFSGKEAISPARDAVKHAQIIAEAACFARNLINTPAQDKTPSALADIAKNMAKSQGVQCKVLSMPELKKLGMGGLLGVAQGSNQPPKFIVLEYNARAKNQDMVVLVGKGITFDSGGICLKQSKDMDLMKTDMSGGAAVMGAIKAVSQMGLPLRVVGLIPCTENMPSGTAIKPGDVVKFYSGKTAEVANTDAEGRLILADALGYAEKYKPTAVIDLATLTGSCVVALGTFASGMMGNNEELKKLVKAAGEKTRERVWELPLWEDYQEQIKSDIADVKNIGGPYAGAITAACFLSKFTEKYPWVHLDIAGTAWCEKNTPYIPKGAAGVGVRLLVQLLRDWTRFPK